MRWLPPNCLETISLTIVLDPIIFPVYFNVNGIITSVALLVVSAIVVHHSSKIYSSLMTFKRRNLDEIIGYYLGKKWRIAYLIFSLVYILQVIQLYTLYITQFVQDFITSSASLDLDPYYAKLISTGFSIPIIACVMICNSTSSFKKFLRLNILFLLFFVITYFCIFISSLQGIKRSYDSSLLGKFDIINFPYFLSQNNYSFHFQMYLQELLVFGSKKQASNKKIQNITIWTALILGTYFGIIGGLIVNEKNELGYNSDKDSIYNLLIFEYLSQYKVTVICMKIFIIYNMLCSIGFKFIIFRQNLIKFLVNKKNTKYFNREKMDFKIKIITIVFLTILNISTTNQQSSFFVTVGSVTCFFILYHIPHQLVLSPSRYLTIKQFNQITWYNPTPQLPYDDQKPVKQYQKEFPQRNILQDDSSSSSRLLQIQTNDIDVIQNDSFCQIPQTVKNHKQLRKQCEVEISSDLESYSYKIKYLLGFTLFVYGLSTLILTAFSLF